MNLRELETRLRTLVETQLIRVLPGQKPEDLLVQRMLAAMRANVHRDHLGARVAPNVYTLLVPPGSLDRWQEPELKDTLLEILRIGASDAGLRFDAPPALTFADDARSLPDQLGVVASYSDGHLERTHDMALDTASRTAQDEVAGVPERAFLIVEGVKEFPLRRPVINIGRRLDNELVVDDPRVSRHHAQLRAIKGRFVLFDLNSSGGTFINGQRASQSILYPGDVISLAGVSLIFGQDNPLPQRDLGNTGPRSQMGAERATAIIRSVPPNLRKRQ